MGYKRQASNTRLNASLGSIASNAQANSMILGGITQASGTIASSYISNQKPKTEPSGYNNKYSNPKTYSNGIKSWDITFDPK
jgi:hypothetical protein